MKIAIIDDTPTDRSALRTLLVAFLNRHGLEAELQEFPTGEDFLEIFTPNTFNICFLDIFMGKLNGMETAREIYRADPACHIVFLSVSTDFLQEGYEVRAWRYLLKPLTAEKLEELLTPLIDTSLVPDKNLSVRVNNRDYCIPYSNIHFVTMVLRNVELHFENSFLPLSSHTTFSQISRFLLTDKHFVLCGKGSLVNMAHVLRLEDNKFLMKNGTEIFISRRRLPDIRSRFLEFTLENL